jgi:hypothetical protein
MEVAVVVEEMGQIPQVGRVLLYGAEMVQQAKQAVLHLPLEQLPVAVRAVQKLETQAQVAMVQFASLTGKRTL